MYMYIHTHTHLPAKCSFVGGETAYVSTRQHTSAKVSISQHTSVYVSICQHTLLAARLDSLVLRQYLYFCTSKASTFELVTKVPDKLQRQLARR